MRILILALFTLCLGFTAEEAAKLPADAQAAIEKAEADITKVRQALIVTLGKCRSAAMKKDDLAGALAIKAKVDEVTALLPKLLTADPPAAPAELPSLVGTWQVLNYAGSSKCSLQITADNSATQVPFGIKGKLLKGTTIAWADGSLWQLSHDNGIWTVQASDGAFHLQKQP